MSKSKLNIYREVPEPITGYILSPDHGFFSVIVPERRVNYVSNPSVETNITGYTDYLGGTGIRSSTRARRGIYSMEVTPAGLDAGVYYLIDSSPTVFVAGAYAVSVDVWAAPGIPMVLSIRQVGAETIILRFIGKGRWERVSAMCNYINSALALGIYVRKDNSPSLLPFYFDGLQCERGAYPTTYIDGDQVGYKAGLLDYFWWGPTHGGYSVRTENCRSGGRVVPLKDLGLEVMSVTGLGMAGVANDIMAYGTLDGGEYHNSNVPSRQYTLAGAMFGKYQGELQRKRSSLVNAIKPDLVIPKQPVVLRYKFGARCENEGLTLEIPSVYVEGMGGQFDNYHQERIALTFAEPYPFLLEDGQSGIELTDITHLHATTWAFRTNNSQPGTWYNVGNLTGGTNVVFDIIQSQRGGLFLVGDFDTSPAGNTYYMVFMRLDTRVYTRYASMGGADAIIRVIYEAPNGNLYVGGDFVHLDPFGTPTVCNHVGYFTGPYWSLVEHAMDSGTDDLVLAIAATYNGDVYVGGDFAHVGAGLIDAPYIARFTAAGVWENITPGVGFDGRVKAIVVGPDGKVYVGGSFTHLNLVDYNCVAVYDPVAGAWNTLGDGVTGGIVRDLCFGADGRLYACGTFTSPGYMAVFNGANWEWLGMGISATDFGTTVINKMCLGPDGKIYLAGDFALTGPSTTINVEYASWDGSTFGFLDAQPPTEGAPDFQACDGLAICVTNAGEVAVSFDYATAASDVFFCGIVTTITNDGSAISHPTFICRISGGVYNYLYIRNVDTGDELRFEVNMDDGGWFFVDSTPGNYRSASNYRSVEQMSFDGSDIATFKLIPGINHISVFSTRGVGTTAITGLYWRNNYWGLDDGTL